LKSAGKRLCFARPAQSSVADEVDEAAASSVVDAVAGSVTASVAIDPPSEELVASDESLLSVGSDGSEASSGVADETLIAVSAASVLSEPSAGAVDVLLPDVSDESDAPAGSVDAVLSAGCDASVAELACAPPAVPVASAPEVSPAAPELSDVPALAVDEVAPSPADAPDAPDVDAGAAGAAGVAGLSPVGTTDDEPGVIDPALLDVLAVPVTGAAAAAGAAVPDAAGGVTGVVTLTGVAFGTGGSDCG
jgi:hypothetical protein